MRWQSEMLLMTTDKANDDQGEDASDVSSKDNRRLTSAWKKLQLSHCDDSIDDGIAHFMVTQAAVNLNVGTCWVQLHTH